MGYHAILDEWDVGRVVCVVLWGRVEDWPLEPMGDKAPDEGRLLKQRFHVVDRLDVVKREMSAGTPRRGRLDANSSFEEIQAEIDRGKRVAAGGCAVLALVVLLALTGLLLALA